MNGLLGGPAQEPPAPRAEKIWLSFRSERWENLDRIVGELEINGDYKKEIFSTVCKLDGLVAESRTLTWLIEPWKAEVERAYRDGYVEALNDFGIWKNGVQHIGCLERPIKEIIAEKFPELESGR